MNNIYKRLIASIMTICMFFTCSLCVSYADVTSAESTILSASSEASTDSIVVSVHYTHKSYATNTEKLGEIVQKDNVLTVKWSVENSSIYSLFKVYRYNPSTGGHATVATANPTTSKNYSVSFPATAGSFHYEVRGFLKSEEKKYISADAVAPKVPSGYITTTTVRKNLWWTAEAKSSIPLYKKPGKSKYTTVPKGKDMKATWKYSPTKFGFWSQPSWVQVKYKGKKLWAKWSKVKMHWHITYKDYSWTLKEEFVNSIYKAKSKTNYLIWVNRYCQRTNVFKKDDGKWKLIKVFDCNTGNYYQPLKGGQYYINGHQIKKEKEHRNGRLYYFMYSTKFGGSGTFHTRCRWSDTGGLRNAVKRHPTTKGCDRLYDAAAKYIYGLPSGTGVVIK